MDAITESADSSAYSASNKRRRASSWHVREARDRLTSSSGTRPAFDYELLRLFAQNRLSASLVILLLVGTVGLLSSVWTGALRAGTWTSAVLMIHAIIVTKSRQFLASRSHAINIGAWRLRFILLDLFFEMSWTFILIHPLGVEEQSGTFMLFVILLVLASPLPCRQWYRSPNGRALPRSRQARCGASYGWEIKRRQACRIAICVRPHDPYLRPAPCKQ